MSKKIKISSDVLMFLEDWTHWAIDGAKDDSFQRFDGLCLAVIDWCIKVQDYSFEKRLEVQKNLDDLLVRDFHTSSFPFCGHEAYRYDVVNGFAWSNPLRVEWALKIIKEAHNEAGI